MSDHSSRHADHRDQSIPDHSNSGQSTSPTLNIATNFDFAASNQPLTTENNDGNGNFHSETSSVTKSSLGISIDPTDIPLNPLSKADDQHLPNELPVTTDQQDECTKQRSRGQCSDVDVALERPEAKDRHVRFTDHVVESVSLIHQMLRRDSRQSISSSQYPMLRERNEGDSDSTLHHDDDDYLDRRHRGASSASVLGTLLRLESKLDRHHSRHIHRRRATQQSDDLKSEQVEEDAAEQDEESAMPRRLSRSADASPFDFTQTHTHLRHPATSKPELKRAFPSTSSLPTQSRLSRMTERPRSWINAVTSSSHVVPSLEKRKREFMPSSRRLSQNSAITTASQFEPITLEDRVHIAFEIANILQKHEFIRKLTKALMLYGCPAHRLEYILKHVTITLNIDAEFVYIPNVMLVAFYDASTHTTETHFIRQTSGFDMHKLGEIYRLEKLVSHGEVTVDEALEFIDRVANDPQFYPQWLNPFVYALISFCGCVMFFGGRFKEAGIAAALAMFFALYELFSGRFWGFQPIWEITVCIFIGFVARAVTKYHFCFIPIAFSSFIVILPGYAIAIAIIELVSRQLVSGVVRMVYAIIYSFLLGYGVEMGSELYVTVDRNATLEALPECQTATNANTCVVAESQWFHFMTVPLFAIAYCQLLRARLPRWPAMLLVSVTGFVVNWLLSCLAHAPQQVIQVVPAFAVGLLGNLMTKLTGKMSFDAVLLAIFYLVPGSLGLKAAIGLFGGKDDEYGSQGASFALSMIEGAIGITIGLFIATLIVYPRGAQHTPLMNF